MKRTPRCLGDPSGDQRTNLSLLKVTGTHIFSSLNVVIDPQKDRVKWKRLINILKKATFQR